MHQPWFAPGGWAWVTGEDAWVKPFATFTADGVEYRNDETREPNHTISLFGDALDGSDEYTTAP